MKITDEMVEAAEEAVYGRHERGFIMKPLVSPINMRKALEATLTAATVSAAEPVKVKPLDDSKDTGWHDDNGRFCLPMSDGYYIKFPKDGEAHSLFVAWYHNTPIGGSSIFKEAQKIAQDHHEHRIRSALYVGPEETL